MGNFFYGPTLYNPRHSFIILRSPRNKMQEMWKEERERDIIGVINSARTPLEAVYIGCPKQVQVLARSGNHGYNENNFFKKIVPAP